MKKFTFSVHGKQYVSPKQSLTGEEILELIGLIPPEDYELFLKIGNKQFEPIQVDEQVDLNQPGIEKFKVKRRFEIPYYLDDEPYSTYECLISPEEILLSNGMNPDQFYLKQIDKHNEITYQNDLNHEISLRPNMKFISCKKSPTPVSYIKSAAIILLENQLEEMGYKTTNPIPHMIAFEFVIPHGRFANKRVEIAIEAPQFPKIPPAGIYVKPHLLPFSKSKILPEAGILARNKPTSEWQYWSRRFDDWNSSDKSMKTYMAFIRTIFDFK